jgi:hypothetical protein
VIQTATCAPFFHLPIVEYLPLYIFVFARLNGLSHVLDPVVYVGSIIAIDRLVEVNFHAGARKHGALRPAVHFVQQAYPS